VLIGLKLGLKKENSAFKILNMIQYLQSKPDDFYFYPKKKKKGKPEENKILDSGSDLLNRKLFRIRAWAGGWRFLFEFENLHMFMKSKQIFQRK